MTAREPSAVEVIAEETDAHDWMQPRGYAWPVCACGREFRGGSQEAAAHQESKVLAALKAAGRATQSSATSSALSLGMARD